MRSNMYCTLVLVANAFLTMPSAALATTILGSVKDLGARNTSTEGIGGVRVRILDKDGKEIGNGLTDGKGRYKITITSATGKLKGVYDKVGYKARPTVLEGIDLEGEQEPVYMVRESGSSSYYERVAQRVFDRAERASQKTRTETASLISKLPSNEKQQVVKHLDKLGGDSILAELESVKKPTVATEAAGGPPP